MGSKNSGAKAFFTGLLLLLLGSMSITSTMAATFGGMEQRITCQTTIENLRWSHRIWPKDNISAKPERTQVLSDEQIRTRVEDNMRMEAALSGLYGIQITPEMLQAELNRIGRNTKMPQRLRELYQALGNDPAVLAECVARPGLVQKLLRDNFTRDDRVHQDVRLQAQRELNSPKMGGELNQIILIRSGADAALAKGKGLSGEVILDSEAFDREASRLESNSLPRLRETPNAFVYETLENSTADQLQLKVLSWRKTDFSSWWHGQAASWQPLESSSQSRIAFKMPLISPALANKGSARDYTTQAIGVVGADTWSAPNPPTKRYSHTAIWTGSEMIVWGGTDGVSASVKLNTGGRYDPVTDTWKATTMVGAPSARSAHLAVWDGSRMIVWAGFDGVSNVNTGGRYDPATDSWTPTSTVNAPSPRNSYNGLDVVWTGSKMIVWGGYDGSATLDTGGQYDPVSDTWTATSMVNVPMARNAHSMVWTGTEMLVWSGYTGSVALNSGARYNPSTDTWLAMNSTGAPSARYSPRAVWTGTEMIAWGGYSPTLGHLNTGGRYNPSTNTWQATSMSGVPGIRSHFAMVWTGSEMVLWGGTYNIGQNYNTGGRYDPVTNTWTTTATSGAPVARHSVTGIWTGTEMIVWGGWDHTKALDSGGRYNPSTNSWIATAVNTAPDKRYAPDSTVWTGSEMIVWGGYNGVFLNTGGRYDPVIDSWTPTSTTGAPSARGTRS